MPRFRFRAVDQSGQYHKGILESQSFQMALDELKSRDWWIIELFDQAKSLLHKDLLKRAPKVKNEHFTIFCRQLSTMYKSGINLVEAIRVLSEQTESKPFRKVLRDLGDDLQSGTSFSVAASAYPSVFTPVFVNMVRAGEASGNLDEMLDRLAVFFEKEYNTKEKVKSAMIYPAIMGVVTVAVVTLMMTFVIPKYVNNFNAMGIELPLPTRIVVSISDWMMAYWYAIPILLFVPAIIINIVTRMPKGTYYLDYMKLKLPVFGKLWQKQAIARFSRTFSSLFAAAIPMLQAMSIVSKVVGNEVIGQVIQESREGIRSGQSIAEPFRNTWIFPPMVVQMLAIGEQSGSLDSMLDKVADFYEADVDRTSDRLKATLEPLMIVFLSVVVGGIVMAVMLPAFKMMGNI